MYEGVLRKLRSGEPVRMAVACYDSRTKTWSFDPRILGENPDKAFDEAIDKLDSLS